MARNLSIFIELDMLFMSLFDLEALILVGAEALYRMLGHAGARVGLLHEAHHCRTAVRVKVLVISRVDIGKLAYIIVEGVIDSC